MAKEAPDAITNKASEKLAVDGSPDAAVKEADDAVLAAEAAANERKKAEADGKTTNVIKATFLRDTFSYETGPGDRTYKADEEVEFATYAEYNRWHRRGACETDADKIVRSKKVLAKKVRELSRRKGG